MLPLSGTVFLVYWSRYMEAAFVASVWHCVCLWSSDADVHLDHVFQTYCLYTVVILTNTHTEAYTQFTVKNILGSKVKI